MLWYPYNICIYIYIYIYIYLFSFYYYLSLFEIKFRYILQFGSYPSDEPFRFRPRSLIWGSGMFMDASLIVRAWPVCDGPSFSSPQMEADGNAVFEQEFFVPVLGQGDIVYNILYTLQVMIFSSFLLILFFAFSPFFFFFFFWYQIPVDLASCKLLAVSGSSSS